MKEGINLFKLIKFFIQLFLQFLFLFIKYTQFLSLISIFVISYQMNTQASQMHEVQKVLDQTFIQGKPYYLIKWKGYIPAISTWQPIQNLIDQLEKVHEWKLQNSPSLITSKFQSSLRQSYVIDKNENSLRSLRGRLLRNNLNTCQENKNERSSQYIILDESDDSAQFEIEKASQYDENKKIKQTRSLSRNIYDFSKKAAKEQDTFKIIGRVKKMQIKSILGCFEWEGNKICQVLLNDGRRVNMRKDDVRNICPEKLYAYYDQL